MDSETRIIKSSDVEVESWKNLIFFVWVLGKKIGMLWCWDFTASQTDFYSCTVFHKEKFVFRNLFLDILVRKRSITKCLLFGFIRLDSNECYLTWLMIDLLSFLIICTVKFNSNFTFFRLKVFLEPSISFL